MANYHPSLTHLLLIALAGLWAGTQNTLAGGGSFITFPTLLLTGLTPLSANMTSCVALFPNQITSALGGRRHAGGVGQLKLSHLFAISVVGGGAGAVLLLVTPARIFASLVPWLVLFATSVFAWGSFLRRPPQGDALHHMPLPLLAAAQFLIAVYGGYFGGGIGFLMLAALTIAGQQVKMAGTTKNVLAMAMNASAVAIFAFSDQIAWPAVLALAAGGIVGGLLGNHLIHRMPEKLLRGFVVGIGVSLTFWLFLR